MAVRTAPRDSTAVSWANWAGDQSCAPAEILSPRTVTELGEAVAAAATAGRKVSVPGSGHSFTEAAMTEGSMLRIEALSGVIDADPASGLVKVGAGTVLADLNLALARLGLAMENLGDIDRQTHRRGDLDRNPRHRRRSAQHLGPGRGDRAGARRRQRPRADGGA